MCKLHDTHFDNIDLYALVERGDAMTAYERLLNEANGEGLTVKELPMVFFDGLIRNRKIGIRKTIDTSIQKADVLAEELMHHKYTVGNILDQSVPENRKQENIARFHAYNKRIGIRGLISAFEAGCKSRYEAAEYLEVTEEFLQDAVDCYREKYGEYKTCDNYIVYFIPHLSIMEIL